MRIAASAALSLSILPIALMSFRRSHPGVRLLTYVVPVVNMIEMLDRGQAGIGVALNDDPHPAIEGETIAHCNVVCLVPMEHRLAKKKVVSASDLITETLISYRMDSLQGRLIAAATSAAGAALRPEIEVDVSITAPAFVQSGLGVALVDTLLPLENFPGVIARPFLPLVTFPICLLRARRWPPSQLHLAIREELHLSVVSYLSMHLTSPGEPRDHVRKPGTAVEVKRKGNI